ncbi:replication factor A protein, partial [Trifolium pratense]
MLWFVTDVIGVMTAISAEREYIRDGKVTKMVVIELTDSSGKCECALCGDYVDDLSKKVGKTASGIPVVVIQFAKVKIFR